RHRLPPSPRGRSRARPGSGLTPLSKADFALVVAFARPAETILEQVVRLQFSAGHRRLVLAGAPIDLMAEPSLPSAEARITPEAVIDDMIRAGDGLVLGRTLLELWPREHDESAFVIDALQFPGAPANEKDRRTVETFLRWQRRTLDLPGPYFLEVFD